MRISGQANLGTMERTWREACSEGDFSGFRIPRIFISPRAKNYRCNQTVFCEFQHYIINMENLARDPERLSKACEWLKSNKQSNLTMAELQDLAGNVERRFEIKVDDTFALAATLRRFETVEKHLRELYWCLSTAPPASEFISCDSPLVVVFREDNKMGLGGGFGYPNVEVSFPLSPKVCLTLDRRTNLKRKSLGDSAVLELNRRAAALAERYIFSAQKSEYVHKLVKAFAVTRRMPKVSRNALRAHLESKSSQRNDQGME
ncbi:MAG: DUF4238 domain-containing protein [Nitrospira sp.]|nr:DUF4238 domain-containing protein [Nitrospira sp.]